MARIALLDPTRTGKHARDLETQLNRLIIGQDEAIREVVNAYQTHAASLCPAGRPVANFLFLGPTGTGKTRVVEATAQSLLGKPGAVIKIDCGEFQHSHEVAKLIGSPPGYLGHRETHAILSQEALNAHFTDKVKLSFVLFDEIEKASDALWNLLLGILDKATLTLGDNRRVDFSAAMIFMTSNLGAREMSTLLSPRLGFHVPAAPESTNSEKAGARMAETGIAAARRKFTPEFINRIDKIVAFRSLGREELRRIVEIELEGVQQRVRDALPSRPPLIVVSDSAKDFLVSEGSDPRYGARPLKRAIERLVVQPLANLIATGQVVVGDRVQVTHRRGAESLTFFHDTGTLELGLDFGCAAA